MALFWVPIFRNLKGIFFTMSRALDVLQMKVETVLKFFAAGTHSGGTHLNFQMGRYIYRRKSDKST